MADGGDSPEPKLEAIRRRFAAKLAERIDGIETAHRALSAATGGAKLAAALDGLIFPVHRMAGSAATFGFTEAGDTAARLEDLLNAVKDAGRPPSAEEGERISTLVEGLRRSAVDEGPPPAAAPPPTPEEGPATGEPRLVFLVEDDAELARDIAAQLGHFGYLARTFPDASDLARSIAGTPPAAVILDLLPGRESASGIEALQGIQGIPTIVISSLDNMSTRLEAVRAGVHGYFTKPLDMARLVESLDQATETADIEPYRIMIVEDDRELAEYYASLLEREGMVSAVFTDPMKVMDPLSDFRPDLILMDINMPGCNGIELAGVIRQNEDFTRIPIVFLTAETSRNRRLLALRSGGDDFLSKPVQPDLLMSSVISRCQRSRLLGSMISRDSMTGLANHSKIKEHLDTELKRAVREDQPLAFAMLDIDRFKSVNDTYGHWTGDTVIKMLAQILRQRLRKTDIVGRYGGEEFAVILPNTDAGNAFRVLDGIRDGFARFRQRAASETFYVTFSCGIAPYPPFDAPPLLNQKADEALYRAKEGGRNRVVSATAR